MHHCVALRDFPRLMAVFRAVRRNPNGRFSLKSAILLRDAGKIGKPVIFHERESYFVIESILHRTTRLSIMPPLVGAGCHLRMSPPPSSKSGLSPNRVFGLFFVLSASPDIQIPLEFRVFRKCPRKKFQGEP